MKQQIVKTTPATDLDVAVATTEAKLNAAVAEQDKLLAYLDDRDAEAKKARITFEREPTPQAHGALAVAEQRERHARAAFEKHAAEILEPAKAELSTVRQAKRRAELDREFPESAVAALVQQLTDVGVAAVLGLSERPRELANLLLRRREIHPEANALGLTIIQYRFTRLVEQANEMIKQTLPRGHAERFVSLGVNKSSSGNNVLRLEIHLPIPVNSYVE